MTTWYRATTVRTLAASVNTAPLLLAELNSFFTDCAAEGASFRWQVASYSSTSPWQLTLKRKDNSPGRVTFFGGVAANPAAMIAAGNFAGSTGFVQVCYDPTATSDTPANYTTGNPWTAANSRGRGMIQCNNMDVPIHRIRAFCSDDGQLFLHGQENNAGHLYMMHVGPIFRSATGGSILYEGLCVQGIRATSGGAPIYVLEADPSSYAPNGASTPDMISFGNPVQSALGYSGFANSTYCSAYISGSWYQINRVTGGRFAENSMTDGSLRLYFLPIFWVTTPDSSAVTPSVLKSKNLGVGPCRNLDAIWTDSNSVVRGFYLGYHGTLGNDRTALSIINDDI
jgi:hypothetical protein